MNKNKKHLAVLSSTAMGLLIASALSTTAQAKVVSYVANDGTNNIKYDLTKLVDDYANKLQNQASPMFDAYSKGTLTAFEDDKKGFVSYDYVEKAYEAALIGGNAATFNMDTVTEAATSADIKNITAIDYNTTPTTLSVSSVSAINGTLTVQLSKTPDSTPVVGDFKVNATVAGTTSVVTPTAITWDATTNTAVLTVDKIGAIATAQAVSYTVGYKDTTAVTSNAFTVAAVDKLAVQDVQLLNARQLKVTFNRQLNQASAETAANYTIQNAAGAGQALTTPVTGNFDATPVLQSDNQTVIITLANALTSGTGWTFTDGDSATVKVAAGVLDASGNPLGADYSKTLTVTDKTAPTVASITASAIATTNKVTIKFSEPVNFASAVIKVDGQLATLAAGTTPDTVIATTASNLTAGSTYSVQIFNIKDSNNNVIAANPTTANVTVTGDTTCLPITSVTAVNDRKVRVVFGEAMTPATITAANLKVLNPNGTDLQTSVDVVVTPTVVAGTSNTTWDFDIAQQAGRDIFGYTNKANLSLIFSSNMKDAAGNALTPVTKTVTLTKDTVAPTVKTVTYVQPGKQYDGATYANGAFVVTLDKDITVPAVLTGIAQAKIKAAVDNTGVDEATVWFASPIPAVAHSSLKNVVVLPLTATPAATVKSVNLTFDTGLVKDTTNGANDSVTTSLAVNMSDSATGYETNKPLVTTALATTPATPTNTVTVTLGDNAGVTTNTGVDVSTVLDKNNYQIDGVKLSSITGAYITTAAVAGVNGYTATITLPAGTVAYPGTANHAFTITGIKDLAGNVMDTYVATANLTDNVKPDLKTGTATVNSDGTLSLGFTESLTTAPVVTDFILYINGTAVTGAAGNLGVNYITSGSTKDTAVLTVKTLKDGTQEFIDADGDGTYNAATDILVGNTTTGTVGAPVAGTYDLRTASGLAVKTATVTAGADAATNTLKSGTSITVK